MFEEEIRACNKTVFQVRQEAPCETQTGGSDQAPSTADNAPGCHFVFTYLLSLQGVLRAALIVKSSFYIVAY
jgi:hypothetical protein